MKTKTKKKPAAKSRRTKTTAKASAARVPDVVIKIYPHVLHVAIDGEEKPEWRVADPQPHHVASISNRLSHQFKFACSDAVKVEHRDSQDKLVSS